VSMKAVCVLVLLAALCVAGARAEEATAVAEPLSAMEEAMPQIDADMDVAADEEESVEEVEGEDEAEVEDEEESESEDEAEAEEEGSELSLIEAEADADKPKRVKIVKKSRAPAAIKPFKFHSERIEASTGNKYEDPEMAKLNLALAAVKEDILSTNKQITDERKWVIAVAKIIASYNDKMKRVEAHIIALRKEMKALYRKKKQIENLKLQKALEAKLKEAKDELATLSSSLKHVSVKQGELNKSGADLRNTIAGLQAQLAKLRGQQIRKVVRKSRKPKAAVKGKARCPKGKRFSKKAKKCVAKKAAKKAPRRK